MTFLAELERDKFREQVEILRELLVRVLKECDGVPVELRVTIAAALKERV
jgi:hypothetical protein